LGATSAACSSSPESPPSAASSVAAKTWGAYDQPISVGIGGFFQK
jgi:hypothetical protein